MRQLNKCALTISESSGCHAFRIVWANPRLLTARNYPHTSHAWQSSRFYMATKPNGRPTLAVRTSYSLDNIRSTSIEYSPVFAYLPRIIKAIGFPIMYS